MANKLVIVISGERQSGKSSLGKFIFSELLNSKIGKKRFVLEKSGKETLLVDTFNKNQILPMDHPSEELSNISNTYSIKLYSFAEPLKKFCIDVLGLDPIQCYGTEDDRNSLTHLVWDDLFEEVKIKHSRRRRGSGSLKPASGNMTAEEVMNVIDIDIFRRIDVNCWARGLYNTINNEGYDVAIALDAKYPSEITMGTENGAKVIRLCRSQADEENEHLKDFPLGEYSLVLDNTKGTMSDTHKKIKPIIHQWFQQKKVI